MDKLKKWHVTGLPKNPQRTFLVWDVEAAQVTPDDDALDSVTPAAARAAVNVILGKPDGQPSQEEEEPLGESMEGESRKTIITSKHLLSSIGLYAGEELRPSQGEEEYEGDYFQNSPEKGAEALVMEFYEKCCAYSDENYRRLRTRSKEEGGYAHIYAHLNEKVEYAEKTLDATIATGKEKAIKRAKRILAKIKALRNEFDNYCRQILVFGFHSNGYDLPLVAGTLTRVLFERKPWKPTSMHDRTPRRDKDKEEEEDSEDSEGSEEEEEEAYGGEESGRRREYNPDWREDDVEEDCFQFVIKRTSTKYITFATNKLKFMDAKEFVAPSCNLVRFLKCFLPPGSDLRKLWFPYEMVKSLADLKKPGLPPYEAFHSRLKGANTLDDDTGDEATGRANHATLERLWKERGMERLEDLLRVYQLADCKPFYMALKNMAQKYHELGVRDPFENLTLASLAWNYVIGSQTRGRLYNTPKHLRYWHQQLQDNVLGGFTSILDQNYGEAGKTPVSENVYGDEALLMRCVQVWDYNSLYPFTMMGDLPASTPCVRHYPEFKLVEYSTRLANSKIGILFGRWLEWSTKRPFAHAGNGPEARVLDYYSVDAHEKDTTNCWDVHGCYYHYHEGCVWNTRGECADAEKKRAEDAEKAAFIRDAGFTYTVVWECQFRAQLKTDPKCIEFLKMRTARNEEPFPVDWQRDGMFTTISCFPTEPRTPQGVPGLTLDCILDAVASGALYGFVLLDVRVKEAYRQEYRKFPNIIARQHIDRSMFTGLQLELALKHNIASKPVSTVAGVYEATEYLAITPMVQHWLSLRDEETNECIMEITHVHQIVEYTPIALLRQAITNLVNLRCQGDSDPAQKVLSEMAKVIMNASFGRSIMRRDRHTRVEIAASKDAKRLVTDPLFRSMTSVLTAEELIEHRNQDAPPQVDLPPQASTSTPSSSPSSSTPSTSSSSPEKPPEKQSEMEFESRPPDASPPHRTPLYEMQLAYKRVCADLPTHLGVFILQAAKLKNMEGMRTLERYMEPAKWNSAYCDTDSLFLLLAEDSLDECVREDMRDEWFSRNGPRQRLFVSEFCERCQDWFIEAKKAGVTATWVMNSCCAKEQLRQSRVPGLLKLEFQGTSFCALCPKSYAVADEQGNLKKTHKGVQKKAAANFDFATYRDVKWEGSSRRATNTGIKQVHGTTVTYSVKKRAVHPVEIKRQWDERYRCHTSVLNVPSKKR